MSIVKTHLDVASSALTWPIGSKACSSRRAGGPIGPAGKPHRGSVRRVCVGRGVGHHPGVGMSRPRVGSGVVGCARDPAHLWTAQARKGGRRRLVGCWDVASRGLRFVQVVVTQGFIGRHDGGRTSTLGREGSDYSASLLAVALGAESVTIWKDVPGMMNADPKWHPEAQTVPKVDHGSPGMSYYGASVIHPRTVKPLQQRGLPLWIRSFLAPEGPATLIDDFPGARSTRMFIWR